MDYLATLVSDEFVTGGTWNHTRFMLNTSSGPNIIASIQGVQANVSTFVALDNSACIKAYNTQLVSEYSNLILVSNFSSGDTVYDTFYQGVPGPADWFHGPAYRTESTWNPAGAPSKPESWEMKDWSCPYYDLDNSTRCLLSDLNDLSLLGCYGPYSQDRVPLLCSQKVQQLDFPIAYCLAQAVTPHCRVQMNATILLAVVICNLAKVVSLLLLLLLNNFSPLVTIGDAIVSFLHVTDRTVSNAGPISANKVRCSGSESLTLWSPTHGSECWSTPWKMKRYRWFRAATKKRWAITCSL